jgi:NAD(P)-dependent dehydrogenase (short-subunit alcohol dehydrogenase family)
MKSKERLLQGKVAIITGANQGLGLEIARKYLEAGASLTICARNRKLLESAEAILRISAGVGQEILALTADVSQVGDVQECVDTTQKHFGRIDILVNNAGIYGPKGAIESVDWQEWVRAIEINLYGSVLMCRAVVPYFRAQQRGKIVQLSGGGATSPLPRLSAYAVSKAAIVRFIDTLAEEVKGDCIDVNAIAPGSLNTRMLDEVIEAGPEKVGQAFYERSLRQKQNGGAPLEKGADLAVFLGSTLSDGITGKLISALWDPWSSLPEHIDDLKTTDIYALRRILPKDRGKNWGNDE